MFRKFVLTAAALLAAAVPASAQDSPVSINLGGGVTAKVNEITKFYAEIRYIHTNGPTFTDPSGVSRTANENYFPFTFGFRFHSAD